MTVIGADAVDAVEVGGTLRVGPRDIVTPLATERAKDRRVTVTRGDVTPAVTAPTVTTPAPAQTSATTPARGTGGPRTSSTTIVAAKAPARTSAATAGRLPSSPVRRRDPRGEAPPAPLRPPSPALFRRGGPLPKEVRPQGVPAAPRGSGRKLRAVVVGAGNVGMIAAMRLADADVFAEIVLVDVDEGRAQGIALDLTHSAALGRFSTTLRGTATVEEAGAADYVIITAGKARQPGMSRSDLISTNAAIVGDVARRVAKTSPDTVIVVVTNPLDEMTQHAWQESGLPADRVLGMAGVLDTARFQALVALTGAGRVDTVDALALGSHGEEMVIPVSQATVGGRPVQDVVRPATLDAVVTRARGSGAEVVGLLKKGSAFFAPGSSAARMVLAMVEDSGDVLPAAVLADGAYGIRDVYVGLPVRVGRRGVREVVEVPLEEAELAALRSAAERIRERVGVLAGSS